VLLQENQWIDTDLGAIIEKLPPAIAEPIAKREDKEDLLEVIMDLGRAPQARFPGETIELARHEITEADLQHVIDRIGAFGGDNRAGVERTLHRISAIRNRGGKVVGLTVRVGRAVYGTIRIIEDLVLTGKSVLLLGRPGVGKTTMLREVARVLADDALRRVIVVDTSNEIAGDGDIPHAGIGHARRMQVPTPSQQHDVMIEGVENHMPEVIVIDEIGTELEATASRTIAERGVQLVATAHGNTIENLITNPTLSDLIGGIDAVTLGDDEARRRRTQKTVLERKAPPTFDILVEIRGRNDVHVHADVADIVDKMLRGYPVSAERRFMDDEGQVHRTQVPVVTSTMSENGRSDRRPEPVRDREPRRGSPQQRREEPEPVDAPTEEPPAETSHILPYGVNKGKLQQAMASSSAAVELVSELADADLLLTTKNFYRRRTRALLDAEEQGKPVYVLRKNTATQIHQFLRALARSQPRQATRAEVGEAIEEAEQAATRIADEGDHQADLSPRVAYIRHLQHVFAEEHGLASSSTGREPDRRVVLYRR
jgi:stage III sporulation protein SpoIIIAA